MSEAIDNIARGIVLFSLNKNPKLRVGNNDIERAFEDLRYAGYVLQFDKNREDDLFQAFLAGYDNGQEEAKDDAYSTKPFLRMTWERERKYYLEEEDDDDA